jgi:hypothetical protein
MVVCLEFAATIQEKNITQTCHLAVIPSCVVACLEFAVIKQEKVNRLSCGSNAFLSGCPS